MECLSDRLLTLDGIIEERDSIRYREVTEADTFNFVESMKNANTKAKTMSDLKKFNEWLLSVGEERSIETIAPEDLDLYMARFFLSIRKKNDKEYEPDSLKSYQSSLHRYLTEKKYNGNILTDESFKHSRDVLSSKRKALKQQGLGNKVLWADPFTDDEMNVLKTKKLLGKGTCIGHFSVCA